MFKKMILVWILLLPLWSCPFDEEDSAVTIEAYEAIMKEVQQKDFIKAKESISAQKELYEYFSKPLYAGLLKATEEKDEKTIKTLLDQSMLMEIEELCTMVEKDFESYKKARLTLIKAKKHLKILSKDKQADALMKTMLKSLGNPGLMGMGKKKSDKALFMQSKKSLLEGLK